MLTKKSSTSISVVLLVAMTMLLVASSVFVFLISNNPGKKITDARAIEEVYAKESQLGFFIKQVALEVDKEGFKTPDEFKEKFKARISGYNVDVKNDAVLFSLIKFMRNNAWSCDVSANTISIKVSDFKIYLYQGEGGLEWAVNTKPPYNTQVLYKPNIIVEVERK
ncbi:MAG: hypothetical protein NT076_01830 [Candidatus Pacearchaeota archaeon]|nr:hypothetical protein [Candidatus Pacearchaeota archaeon]